MKINLGRSDKLALLSAAVCAVMLAFSQNASAARQPMPPDNVVSVPDGGATIMLLGAALGTLGMARRFLKR